MALLARCFIKLHFVIPLPKCLFDLERLSQAIRAEQNGYVADAGYDELGFAVHKLGVNR